MSQPCLHSCRDAEIEAHLHQGATGSGPTEAYMHPAAMGSGPSEAYMHPAAMGRGAVHLNPPPFPGHQRRIAYTAPPGGHRHPSWTRSSLSTSQSARPPTTSTLDPLASGVLVIALGSATRLLEYLTSDDKTYVADVTFGITTRTYDREGDVVTRTDPSGIDATIVQAQLDRFRGTIEQRPPAFSAVSVNGKRMYDLAR
ncbi:MAG: hypothetical protein EBT47_05120, partial [Chloroflexi bacterium]|nr:hypothetical protein [Chloroflexota bacterium]